MAVISFLASYRRKRNQDPLKPKVIYAASGGCLIESLAVMSSFTESVEHWTISSDMFINRPTPITPRLLTFSLKGFLYHRTDLTKYVKELFVPHKIQDVEIVSGYYDLEDAQTFRSNVKVVTNYPRSKSVLSNMKKSLPNIDLIFANETPTIDYNSLEDLKVLKDHLDSVRDLMIDTLHKTSNIPFMMEPLGESSSVDYGVVAPSPRIVVNGNIDKSMYFCPVNIDRIGKIKDYDMIYHKTIMNDVLSIQNTFKNSKRFDSHDMDKSFEAALSVIKTLQTRYCLVIYSTFTSNIPINHFTDDMVKLAVTSSKNNIRFLLLHD